LLALTLPVRTVAVAMVPVVHTIAALVFQCTRVPTALSNLAHPGLLLSTAPMPTTSTPTPSVPAVVLAHSKPVSVTVLMDSPVTTVDVPSAQMIVPDTEPVPLQVISQLLDTLPTMPK